jgi:hypothetical protein
MLAKANSVGFIEASIPGLARVANLTIDETLSALEVLKAPDPYSKNPGNEGRRVIEAPGGFLLLNYEEYRARRSEEERREYMREYMKEYREGRKQSVNNVNNGKHLLAEVSHGKPGLAQAETETETETETEENNTNRQKPVVRESDFELWYKEYPKKVEPDAAEKAFKKVIKTILQKQGGEVRDAVNWLIKATRDRCPELAQREKRFIPHPATWLNRGGYKSEIVTADSGLDEYEEYEDCQ